MKVFKRRLAAFLTVLLLVPGRPTMASNVMPPKKADVSTSVSEEKTTEENLQDSESRETVTEESEETRTSEENTDLETETSIQSETLDEEVPGTEETSAGEETSKEEDEVSEKEADSEEEESGTAESTKTDRPADSETETKPESSEESRQDESENDGEDLNAADILLGTAAKLFTAEELTATPGDAEKTTKDEVRFNTGNHEFRIVDQAEFDKGSGDACFKADGSYTIEIQEENPFFPYEVQFTYDGKTSRRWFMTPDDTVTVGGHKFYVSASFDGTAVTQMSLEVAGDTVVVYPEKKEFTNGDGAALMSLLPLEERYLQTIDLTEYTPVELTMVSAEYIFGNKGLADDDKVTLGDADKVAWTYDSYGSDDDDYSISQKGDKLNLSRNTTNGYSNWQMIVGDADQLNMGNIRYLVSIRTKDSSSWLIPTVYKQYEDGNRAKVSVSSSRYNDYKRSDRSMEESRGLYIEVPLDELDRKTDAYVSLAINESMFPFGTTQYSSLKVYSGKTISAEADITAQILAQDMTAKDSGYLISADSSDDLWITIAAYDSAGNLSGCLPVELSLYRSGNDVDLHGLYDLIDDQWQRIGSYDYDYLENDDDDLNLRITKCNYTYALQDGYALDKEYYLKMEYSRGGVTSSSSVTAAYIGQYSSIAQAADAGAAEIKNTLFNQSDGGGYKANYSTGVYFTIFVGADGSEKQEIYQYQVKTAREEIGEPALSDSTYVRFTGLNDRSGNRVPCYPVNIQEDTYGDYSYRTLLVDEDIDLTDLAPVFYAPPGINLYTDGNLEKSGESYHDFSQGAIHYTAGSESKKEQQNYWLQVVKKIDGNGGLYINSLNDPEAHTQVKDGVIYSTREMVMDGRYDYQHDILLINTGTADIPALKAELASEQVELDPYWTLKGDQVLLGFGSLKTDYQHSHGELQNFAKLRIKPKDGVERGDISGTLTISSGSTVLMVLNLTGTIGDPYITTTEIPDAVKYVPYSVMIQNNNKYDFNRTIYRLEDGTLPGGMRIYPNGELYGIPQESGTFTFTVHMENTYNKFKPSEQTLTLNVKENTNLNVYNESDENYTIKEHLGREIGAGSRDYLLQHTNDQVYVSYGEFGDFIDLWLNGEKLTDGVDYTKESGSTRLTIKSQTFTTKARKGTNTIAAEFRVGGNRDNDLKRTAQNFRIGGSSSGSQNTSGGSSGSGGGSRRYGNSGSSGSIPNSSNTRDAKKGYVHAQNGIITGQGSGYSRWQQDENGWKLIYADGTTASGRMTTLNNGNTVEQILWEKINGAWYAFGVNGYLKSGWVFDYQLNSWYNVSVEKGMQSGWYTDSQDKHTYYLDPQNGSLAAGWKAINDKWYYFNASVLTPTWELDPETGNWYYNIRSRSKPFGAMYQGENTPDGYFVGSDGIWNGQKQ